MIRIQRGSPPPELAAQETNRIPAARALAAAGTLCGGDLKGYGVARRVLYRSQHRKCAYCEWEPLAIDWSPVEHYRPKGYYWWLTWHWDNLLFACQWCNSKHKLDQFPLRDAATRLVAEEVPPGHEDPLIIDPAGGGDPRQHIEFVLIAQRWQPIPRNGSEYGDMTIRVLGLDQPPLLDEYQRFYTRHLRNPISNVRKEMLSGDPGSVRRCWGQLVETIDPRREFAAFALDVVEQSFPPSLLAEWDLRIPTLA